MGSVKITIHEPLLLAPGAVDAAAVDRRPRRCLHAALWLSVVLEPWQVHRSGHLHVVRELDATTWRQVDLSRHPLRTAPGSADTDADALAAELRQALSDLPLCFYRVPDVGLVSEIGEGRDDFRRRAAGVLRPEVQRRLDALAGESPPRLPWRRRAATRRINDAKAGLAAQVAALVDSIETLELPSLADHVHRAQVGHLLVAAGVRLEPPRHRRLML